MSTEADNVSILRKAYETWESEKAADIDCWIRIVDEDARLTALEHTLICLDEIFVG